MIPNNNINNDTLYSEEEIRKLKRKTRYLENSIHINERRLDDLKYIKGIIIFLPKGFLIYEKKCQSHTKTKYL